ncbi:MAG: NRDE family protein [Thermoanaerobaculia bacterium]
MCLALIAAQVREDLPLVVAANRDEFHARPTAPSAFWMDAPGLLAGRDLSAGGTWLGVTRGGRFALLTNHRDPRSHRESAPSRGALVAEFLKGEEPPEDFLRRKEREAASYNGFHLVVGDLLGLWYFTNTNGALRPLSPGVHGISNGPVDEPWPKVTRSTARLARLLEFPAPPGPEALLELLSDRERSPDSELPSTGIPLEWERALSSVFVVHGSYGTRCSTAFLVSRSGTVRFVERSFDTSGASTGTVDISFRLAR